MSILVVTTCEEIRGNAIDFLDSKLGVYEIVDIEIPHIKEKHKKVNNELISTPCYLYRTTDHIQVVVCSLAHHRQITVPTITRIIKGLSGVVKVEKAFVVWELDKMHKMVKIDGLVPWCGFEPAREYLSRFIRNRGDLSLPRSRKKIRELPIEKRTCVVCKEALSTAAFQPCGHLTACDECAYDIWNFEAVSERHKEPECPTCKRTLERPPLKVKIPSVK